MMYSPHEYSSPLLTQLLLLISGRSPHEQSGESIHASMMSSPELFMAELLKKIVLSTKKCRKTEERMVE